MKSIYFWILIMMLSVTSLAQEDSLMAESDSATFDMEAMIDSIEKSMNYQTGTITLGDSMATIVVPEGFGFLDPDQARYVLEELWGNPPSETFGLLIPTGGGIMQEHSWAFEISFDDMGFVKDEDADDINYEDLLTEMQNDTKLASDQRVEMGYEEVSLMGWASTPFYDNSNKVLHWAKELKFGTDSLNTLNDNIRILGRKGVMVVNAIGGMDMFESIKPTIDKVMHSVTFTDGNQYDEFDPSIDKVAAYTVGGLVAGKVLAKAGVLGLLAKFGKFIILGLVAAGGFIWKFISGRKKNNDSGIPGDDMATKA